jgi:hypothetical protein
MEMNMVPSVPEAFAGEIRKAVRDGDEVALQECGFRYPLDWGGDPSLDEAFPDTVFSAMLDIIADGSLPAMENSVYLLKLFEDEWDNLTGDQKENLLPVLRDSYAVYANKLAYFVISEILGEYYCDSRAFEVLEQLESTPNPSARALVPHGFEHIASGADSPDLRRKASARLEIMRGDLNDAVRDEAEISIQRVARRKKSTELSGPAARPTSLLD